MTWIGVDPGKKGATCIITDNDVHIYPWEDGQFVYLMRELSDNEEARNSGIVACVEKVGAMPGQGVTSMFSFGKNAGYIEGVLTALGIPYQLIPPKKWKGEFGLNSDKAASVAVCKKLFPDVSLRRSDRCRKDDDGMAEALLMALYAKRKL